MGLHLLTMLGEGGRNPPAPSALLRLDSSRLACWPRCGRAAIDIRRAGQVALVVICIGPDDRRISRHRHATAEIVVSSGGELGLLAPCAARSPDKDVGRAGTANRPLV